MRTGNYVIIFSSLRIFVSRHDTSSVNVAVRLFTQPFGACRSGCEAMADGRFGTDNFSEISDMTRFFIHFLLLAVCAAAPAQTLKDLEKAHKDKMKELKKSLKLKRVEIRQDPDGTYYMLLMSKSKLVGRADMEGKVILPAVYYSIVKDRLSDGKDVFIVNNGHDKNGIADMSGKFIVPTQYSSFLFCDAIDKGVDYVYDNQMERTGDSVAVYHDSEPAVIYAKGTPSRIYDLDGTVLRDSIMTDKRDISLSGRKEWMWSLNSVTEV